MCRLLWKTLINVSFCTVSIKVFIRLIAIPLATFSESQWGIEDNREDFSCDKTNNKGEVSEQLIKMFLKDLPSVAWANLMSLSGAVLGWFTSCVSISCFDYSIHSQYANWDLNKTSNTLAGTLTGLFLMAYRLKIKIVWNPTLKGKFLKIPGRGIEPGTLKITTGGQRCLTLVIGHWS